MEIWGWANGEMGAATPGCSACVFRNIFLMHEMLPVTVTTENRGGGKKKKNSIKSNASLVL